MEIRHSQTSSTIVKYSTSLGKRQVKLQHIHPSQTKEEQSIQFNKGNKINKVKLAGGQVLLTNQSQNFISYRTIQLRPVYSLEFILKTIEIVNANFAFTIQKKRSFPTNKYTITDHTNTVTYQLTSNFFGSKYNLTKDGTAILTISFHVGCGNQFRKYSVFSLKPTVNTQQLRNCSDLAENYEKQNYVGKIDKYESLDPHYSMQKEHTPLILQQNLSSAVLTTQQFATPMEKESMNLPKQTIPTIFYKYLSNVPCQTKKSQQSLLQVQISKSLLNDKSKLNFFIITKEKVYHLSVFL